MKVFQCIGCGCDDYHACWDDEANTPCSWVRKDPSTQTGVCSVCRGHTTRFDQGDREFAVPVEPRELPNQTFSVEE